MKIRPVGAELFYADRQRDVTKLIDAFRNFAKAHKKKREKESKVCVDSNREEKNFSLPNTEYMFHVYDPMLRVKQEIFFKKNWK